ncbi:MAG TPA: MFS transporter [Dehalococcoidia bacterium]|nr:MFS transporter [Dehalococcoidia bacterium]
MNLGPLGRVTPRRRPPAPATHAAVDADAAPAPAGATFRALRNRNYRLFYTGQIVSLCGTWMQTIAQAWLVIDLTDSKVALGTVTMLQFLPITMFVLFAGVIADRVPKRNFLVATQSLAMVQALLLAALVFSGAVELWHVYVLAFVLGVANAFDQPTRQAFVVEMVGREDLMNAVALNSGMFNAARLIGPSLGGFVIAAFGVKTAFLLNGISFIPVILALLMIDASKLHTPAQRREGRINPLAELREGIAYAFTTPAALLIVILVAIIGTFGYNFTVFTPLLARYVVDGGEVALGFMTAAVGLGALISALLLARRTSAARGTLFGGAIAFSVLLAAAGVSQWLALSLLFLVLLGVANTAFASTANTSMQLATPDRLRGRVMAVYMLLFAGSTPVGGYLTGLMAEQFGVSTALVIEAAVCLAGAGIGLAYYLRHRSRVDEGADIRGEVKAATRV